MIRTYLNQSFRRKLLAGFLVIGIVPLIACVALLLGIFRFTLEHNAVDTAQTQLQAVEADFAELFRSCSGVMAELDSDEAVRSALTAPRSAAGDRDVYYRLYTAAGPLMGSADFSLFDAAGHRVYSTANSSTLSALPTDWGVLKAARDSDGLVLRDVEDFTASGDTARLRAAQALHDGETPVGYAVMEMTAAHLQRLLDGKYGATSGVLVLDPYWSAVYTTPSVRGTTLVPQLRAQLLRGQSLSDGGGEYSYFVLHSPSSGLYLVMQQPKPLAAWIMRLLYLVTAVSIALCLGLCVLVSMGITRQLFEPIRALNSAMAQVEGGCLDVRLDSHRVDEMGQLSSRFDRMVTRLKSNLADSLRQQRELNDAQIRMMQAQLNPHFLYNTLDTIKWLGKINRVPEVATISADLADILRSSISSDEFVPLEQELRLLDRYVEIQRIRFSGKFSLSLQVDPGLEDVLVPKLMLQPLVENAIVHGFEDRSGGEIAVSARRMGEEMEITVRDDGCGMSEESLKHFQTEILPGPGRHLGLHNVDAILRLHYGPDHGLRFVPVQGGTCVRITLPITRQGGEQPC